MFNYANLNDVEFEYLCKDIMQRKLSTELHSFARGKDGGIDLCDDVNTKNVIIQAKHYVNSSVGSLKRDIKKEKPKVDKNNPKHYYVCISRSLPPSAIEELYLFFEPYMDSPATVL